MAPAFGKRIRQTQVDEITVVACCLMILTILPKSIRQQRPRAVVIGIKKEIGIKRQFDTNHCW